jgi:ATP-dependent protease ClpP protease subunit
MAQQATPEAEARALLAVQESCLGANQMPIEFRLAFNGEINAMSTNAMRHRIATILEQKEFGSLMILFSSFGGQPREGVALYNFISQLPVPVHMHNMGHVESAAIPIFLAGKRRTAEPISRFLFHSYNWTFGPGTVRLPDINEASKQLSNEANLTVEIIKKECNVPDDIVGLIGAGATPGTRLVDAAEAKDFGLIHEIGGLSAPAPDWQVAVWTVGW